MAGVRAANKVAKEIADVLHDHPGATGILVRVVALQHWLLLLAPKPRKVRSKTARKSRATMAELDALCREIVMKRDGGCVFCLLGAPGVLKPGTQLQWCHVHTRRYRWIRHDLHNSWTLCAGHHMWQHQNPVTAAPYFEKIIANVYGRGAVARLRMLVAKPRKTDLGLVKAYLENEKAKL